MTPLIREWTSILGSEDPHFVECHWFDMSDVFHPDALQNVTLSLDGYRPPFEKTVIVARGFKAGVAHDFLCYLLGSDPEQGIILNTWIGRKGQKPASFPTLIYVISDSQVFCSPVEDGETISDVDREMILRMVAMFYATLNRGASAHFPRVKEGLTSRRLRAKGRAPLYDWVTVEVAPVKPKAAPQGGTHASPRAHDRRGHLRRLPSGKSVWVRPCRVGNEANGFVFHDYKIVH
jgi:hypothetical protein